MLVYPIDARNFVSRGEMNFEKIGIIQKFIIFQVSIHDVQPSFVLASPLSRVYQRTTCHEHVRTQEDAFGAFET